MIGFSLILTAFSRSGRASPTSRAGGGEAIAFAGDRVILRDHLAKGRPLVVAIDAGRGRLHDVVVVGFDDERAEAIVHDPARGPHRRMGVGQLERKWAKSGNWALLVTPRDMSSRGASILPGDEGPTAAGGSLGTGQTDVPRDDSGASQDDEATYETLLSSALAAGRAERYADAAEALDRAIALDPARPEAWTERGGLRFLEGRYQEAVADLRRSLALREDQAERRRWT